MKKTTLLIVLVVSLSCVFLSSCNRNTVIMKPSDVTDAKENTNAADGLEISTDEKNDSMSKLPFELEPDKANLPSYADLCKIKRGMTKDEVYSIAGNPQRMEIRPMSIHPTASLTFDATCFIYDSSDGPSICVSWRFAEIGSPTEIVLLVDVIQDVNSGD